MSESTPSLAELRDWLTRTTAELLERDPDDIDPDVDMVRYGATSLIKVELSAALEERFGIEVADDFLWRFPTVEDAAAELHHVIG